MALYKAWAALVALGVINFFLALIQMLSQA
jgi:hypothetical protein